MVVRQGMVAQADLPATPQNYDDDNDDEHGKHGHGRVQHDPGHVSVLDVALALVKFDVLLRITSAAATTAVGLLLLVVVLLLLLLGTVMRDGVLNGAFDVGIDWLERTNVLQFSEVQRWVLVRCYGPD